MARPAEPGRSALLEAGRRVLASPSAGGLGALSANAVVAEATMSKGAFFHHFPTRRDFVLALHAGFHDEVARAIDAATTDLAPGIARLRRGVEAYLDFCLGHEAAKALLFSARADHDLADVVVAANARFARIATRELRAAGLQQVRPLADLLVGLAAEVAQIERERGRRSPAHRHAIWRLFDPLAR